jgi:hypothetical protein
MADVDQAAEENGLGLFLLPEYDKAFREFVFEAINMLARARDPLLSQIRSEESEAVGTSRVSGPVETVELEPMPVRVELAFPRRDVIQCNIEPLLTILDEAAEQHLRQIMPALFETISRITDATGNKIDAGGKPFSAEMLLEALEQIEWSFDEEGEPIMPTLVMHPNMAKKLSELPPLTPEQEQAFADLKERKRAEYRAGKRHRRLS